jgi:mono/diheme cytochrome c family protein
MPATATYAAAMVRRLLAPVLAPVLVAACAAFVIAGCGGAQSRHQTRSSAPGRELFARACGACHTINGHEDPRRQGGDLLGFHSSRAQMLQLAGEMPVRHPLTQSQLEAVVRFVMSLEAGSRQ